MKAATVFNVFIQRNKMFFPQKLKKKNWVYFKSNGWRLIRTSKEFLWNHFDDSDRGLKSV